MPEVIELSSSPEPEPKKRRIDKRKDRGNGVSQRKGKEAEVNNKINDRNARDGKATTKVHSAGASGPSSQASKPNLGFGDEPASIMGEDTRVKEKVAEKVKEKEMSEAEKIRELRLKRFGGITSASSPSASQITSSPNQPLVAESTITTVKMPSAGKSMDTDVRAGKDKSAPNLTKTSNLGGKIKSSSTKIPDNHDTLGTTGSATMSRSAVSTEQAATIDDSYGIFDFTQESEDDLPSPRIEPRESRKSSAFGATGMRSGTNGTVQKDVDDSDPFRSSSPPGVPKNTKAQSHKSVAKSNVISLDDSDDFDDDLPAPVAKRRRISPGARTSTLPSREHSSDARAKEGGGYRRTVSNVAKSGYDAKAKASGLKRSKTATDDILFTSSFDPFEYKNKKADKGKNREGSDDGFVDIDDLFPSKKSAARPAVGGLGGLKSKGKSLDSILSDDDDLDDSDLDLPDFSQLAKHKPKAKTPAVQSKNAGKAAISSPASKPKSAKAALNAYEKEKLAEKKAQEKVEKYAQKAREKAEKEAQKIAAKEEAKEKKRVEKEEKAKEKEKVAAFAKVNTLKTNKTNSTPEMIVDFPNGMDDLLITHTKVLLEGLKVEMGTWNSPVPNVIKFRRKVVAKYDEKTDCWVPVEPHVQRENHVIVIIKAKEFLDLINGEEGKDLVCHILKMKGKFENWNAHVTGSTGKNITYLIEGLALLLKKNKNAQNRRFAERVRNQGEPDAAESSTANGNKRKRKEKADEMEGIDEAKVEDALIDMQVIHGLLVHHTAALAETAAWITAFTQSISTVPYRHQKSQLPTNICLESGQTKSGTDAADTYIKMLQETSRLTDAVAKGIAGEYPSVTELVEAYEEAGSEHEAKMLLKDLKKKTNANGSSNEMRIGEAMSRRVWNVFMGRDEDSGSI